MGRRVSDSIFLEAHTEAEFVRRKQKIICGSDVGSQDWLTREGQDLGSKPLPIQRGTWEHAWPWSGPKWQDLIYSTLLWDPRLDMPLDETTLFPEADPDAGRPPTQGI